ncbi:MAG: serine/threonine-protein phosphatase [Acidobacteria bacterium]|nr:serine/threonine-protein phosphatase [Acidobacteriota bacterium]
MHLLFAAATDPGLVRQRNEDRYVADAELGFFLVVDGMGGHASGELASATVAEAATAFIRETARDSDRTWPFGLDAELSPLANRLQVAVRSANRALAVRAQRDAALNGSGATLAAALFGGGRLVVSNVGDCRAYLVRRGRLTQITRDHSLVAEQVAMGLIDSEQARTHPLRHVVTRAVSGDAGMVVDIWEMPVDAGDRILLCSDGVHGVVPDRELTALATATDRTLDEICGAVITAAKAHGAPDNATAVLIEAAA